MKKQQNTCTNRERERAGQGQCTNPRDSMNCRRWLRKCSRGSSQPLSDALSDDVKSSLAPAFPLRFPIAFSPSRLQPSTDTETQSLAARSRNGRGFPLFLPLFLAFTEFPSFFFSFSCEVQVLLLFFFSFPCFFPFSDGLFLLARKKSFTNTPLPCTRNHDRALGPIDQAMKHTKNGPLILFAEKTLQQTNHNTR